MEEEITPSKFGTVAVLGATGGVGRHVLRLALERGFQVRAFARNPSALEAREGLTVVQGDVFDADAVARLVEGADAVLVALGSRNHFEPNPVCSTGVKHALQAMQLSGGKCRRIVAVSSAGVGPRQAYPWCFRLLFIDCFLRALVRHEYHDLTLMEEALSGADPSAVDWTLVRPSALTNGKPRRQEIWVASENPADIRPMVARVDVARFMLDCVPDPARHRKFFVLGYELPLEHWWYSCCDGSAKP